MLPMCRPHRTARNSPENCVFFLSPEDIHPKGRPSIGTSSAHFLLSRNVCLLSKMIRIVSQILEVVNTRTGNCLPVNQLSLTKQVKSGRKFNLGRNKHSPIITTSSNRTHEPNYAIFRNKLIPFRSVRCWCRGRRRTPGKGGGASVSHTVLPRLAVVLTNPSTSRLGEPGRPACLSGRT